MANVTFSEVEYQDDKVKIVFWEEGEYDWEEATVEVPFSSVCWRKNPNAVYKNHAINRQKNCVHFLIEADGKSAIVKYTSQDLANELYERITAPPFPY